MNILSCTINMKGSHIQIEINGANIIRIKDAHDNYTIIHSKTNKYIEKYNSIPISFKFHENNKLVFIFFFYNKLVIYLYFFNVKVHHLYL